jgi:hypothetical protein
LSLYISNYRLFIDLAQFKAHKTKALGFFTTPPFINVFSLEI